jgi:hypothetical protein
MRPIKIYKDDENEHISEAYKFKDNVDDMEG